MNEIPVAILGATEGNGHPFSFSAIINGYDDRGLSQSGWPGIHDYVRRRDASEFGIGRLRVTHAWTQDPEITDRLCSACRIPHRVGDPAELLDQVGAVIIARDDHENHWRFARPFLEKGTSVFLDKPLSMNPSELQLMKPYLEAGKLMSCSGLRFARELDLPRSELSSYGRPKLVRGSVLLDWPRYGVHIVEGILGLLPSRPTHITAHRCDHTSLAIEMDDGALVLADALGNLPKTFRIDIYGTQRITSHEIEDNFSMFRRMLWHFADMVETAKPPIPPDRTLDIMRVLIAGERARNEGRRIGIDELGI